MSGFNKILVGFIFLFVLVIGAELFFLFVYPGNGTGIQNKASSVEYLPVQPGLFTSYVDMYQVKDVPISNKLIVSSEYEGRVGGIDFKTGEHLTFKLNNYDVWISVFKKPRGFRETKCETYDAGTGAYVPYTFAAAPFKNNDKIIMTLDVDFKNLTTSCRIKPVQ